MNTGVEFMREHVPEDARIHYVIKNGGEAANVVPPTATAEYMVRAPDRDQVEEISDWIEQVARGAAMIADVDVDARKTSGIYELLPNVTLGEAVLETMEDLGSFELDDEESDLAADLRETLGDVSDAVADLPEGARPAAADAAMFTDPIDAPDEGETGSYSTDSGDVSQVVPLGRLSTATWPVGTPGHSWQAVAASGSVGTEGMLYAAKTIGGTLYDLLDDPDLLAAARDEFEERSGDREYECPLPDDVDPHELVDR
jgi:aminobenzoyl-glutamate utilization protein B